jgi:hypothetical protein
MTLVPIFVNIGQLIHTLLRMVPRESKHICKMNRLLPCISSIDFNNAPFCGDYSLEILGHQGCPTQCLLKKITLDEYGALGSVEIEARGYKPNSRGFESQCHLIVSNNLILPASLCPGDYLASNRNEYQKVKKNVSREKSTTRV